MTVLEFISSIVGTLALVLVAIIEHKGNKRQKQTDNWQKDLNARSELRRQESLLNMQLTAANSELCEVICIAVTGGHTNGNVEAARKKVKEAREKYERFLQETTINALEK